MLKRMGKSTTDQDTPLSGTELRDKLFVLRLMTDPEQGLSPLWNGGQPRDPLPPILVARSDGKSFSKQNWDEIRDFFDTHMPQAWQLTAVDATASPLACFSEAAFLSSLTDWCYDKGYASISPEVSFAERFPLGARVEAQGLRKEQLNSLVGTVVKLDEARSRVGVDFGPPHGLLSIHTKNLLCLSAK